LQVQKKFFGPSLPRPDWIGVGVPPFRDYKPDPLEKGTPPPPLKRELPSHFVKAMTTLRGGGGAPSTMLAHSQAAKTIHRPLAHSQAASLYNKRSYTTQNNDHSKKLKKSHFSVFSLFFHIFHYFFNKFQYFPIFSIFFNIFHIFQ
jgi:hypothetical protein